MKNFLNGFVTALGALIAVYSVSGITYYAVDKFKKESN